MSLSPARGADFASSIVCGDRVIGTIGVQVKFRNNFNHKDAMKKTLIGRHSQRSEELRIRLLIAYPKETKFELCTVQNNTVILIIDKRNMHRFLGPDITAVLDGLKSTGHLEKIEEAYTKIQAEAA